MDKEEKRKAYEVRKEGVKERVQKLATINFSITNCPQKIYEDFVMFCKEETNDNYSMGLKLLVENNQVNARDELLYESIVELRERVGLLENLDKPVEEEQKKEQKTFGKK